MSTNISKQKRDTLIAEIAQIKDFITKAKQDENTQNLLSYLADLSKEVNGKKYGLVFEEHREAIDETLENTVPVLNYEKDLTVHNGGEMNFLLEGDNLASLKLLEKTHKGRIDVIYIDPPYNTGNKDFVYDDSFVDTNDTFRHSKWLSFMQKRLEIARGLLSEKGVIFISIDDNEQAALKMLCDEIFGAENFVSDMAWQRTYSTRNDSKGIPVEVEHILVYSKNTDWSPNKLPRTEKMNSLYKSPDNDPKPWTSSSLSAPGAATHQGMVYAIQHPFSGEMMYPTVGRCWALGQPQMLENMNKWCPYELKNLNDEKERAAVCGVTENEVQKNVLGIVLKESVEKSKKLAQEILDKGNWPYFYFTNGGKGGIRRKTYLEDMDGRMPTNFLSYDEVGHTDEAKKEVLSIFGGLFPFDTPKPTRLIERILQLSTDNCSLSTVLDFFAGSGTTGHAVLKLNAEDGGHRKFILCTNNENEICRKITYERLKTVITGIRTDGSKYSDGLSGSLKYFKVDFVPITEKLYYEYADELLLHVKELVELENALDFDTNKSVAIVLTDEELEEFCGKIVGSSPTMTENGSPAMTQNGHAELVSASDEEIPNQVRNDGNQQVRNDVEVKTLYLGHDVLPSSKQERIIKSRGIAVNIVPEYYYSDLNA